MVSQSEGWLAKTRFGVGVGALVCTTTCAWFAMWALAIPLLLGWSPIAIFSNSMAPGIETGDIIVAKPHDGHGLGPGHVIVYQNPGDRRITHRIVDLTPSGDYVTRGDASGRIDTSAVPPSSVQGVGRLRIPFVGHPYVWASNGSWLPLLLTTVAAAFLLWTSRWGLLAEFDPWRTPPDRVAVAPVGIGSKRRRSQSRLRTAGAVAMTLLLVASIVRVVDSRATFGGNAGNPANSWTADTLEAPTALTATDGASITLDWTPTPDTYATGHRIYRSTTPGGPYSQIADVTPHATATYIDNPGAGTYHYIARAYTTNWESLDSNEDTAIAGSGAAFNASADSFVRDGKPGENNGTGSSIEIASGPDKNTRAFIQFDISSIPAASSVNSATLTLCASFTDAARMIEIHRVTGVWTELGLTLSNEPTVAATATDTVTQPNTMTCEDYTVTADVQAWVDGTANYGWRLRDTNEDDPDKTKISYRSREDALVGERPMLVVDYD